MDDITPDVEATESTEVAEVQDQAPPAEAASSTEATAAPDTSVEDPGNFGFDASRVPPELQGVFKEMQGAVTKKFQSIAEARKEAEAIRSTFEGYDDINAVRDFLDQLRTPEGLREFWDAVGQEYGWASGESGNPAQAEVPDEAELDRPLTVREWQEMQREQQLQAQQQAEDAEVHATLDKLGVPDDLKHLVLTEAWRQSPRLSLSERINKGYESLQKTLEAQVEARQKAKQEKAEKVPPSISAGGGVPVSGKAPPKTLEEARARSIELLNAYQDSSANAP